MTNIVMIVAIIGDIYACVAGLSLSIIRIKLIPAGVQSVLVRMEFTHPTSLRMRSGILTVVMYL